jgi:hypothetical protein
MFRFAEDSVVALAANDPGLDLNAGTIGVVWALYNTIPPSYEVTFTGKDGLKFDVTMSEEELTKPAVTHELAIFGSH